MALPKDITYILGVRDTADQSSQSINPKQPFAISTDIYKYNPNSHQLLSWLMKTARYKPTRTHKFFHMETAPLPGWVKYTGADESSQGVTGLAIDTGGARLSKGCRIRWSRTGEITRLTADMSTNSTQGVTRNFGTDGTPFLKNGDLGKLLPMAKTEGDLMGKGMTAGEVVKSFTTGIVEWAVQMTGTQAAEGNVDGDQFANALADAWDQSKDQLEADVVLGGAVEDDSSYTYPMHTSEGLLNWISTNVYALQGTLSRMDLWDMLAEWRTFNKMGGAILTSHAIITLMNTWAFQKVIYNQNLTKDGINIQQITCPSGTFDLIDCDLFNQENYLRGTMLFLPNVGKSGKARQGIDYRPLIGVKNRDIAYKPVERDEYDLDEGHIFGELGWEFWGEERFMAASGIEF